MVANSKMKGRIKMKNKISVPKGFPLTVAGLHTATIEAGFDLVNGKEVLHKGNQRKANILTIPFRLDDGTTPRKDFYFVMDTGTKLGELVAAVVGAIPDEGVDDLEELLVGQQVTVQVMHHTSKDNKTYANIVEFYPADYEAEEADEDELDYEDTEEQPQEDEDEELELEEETEESGSEEFGWDREEEDEDPDDGGNFDTCREDQYDRQNDGPDDDPDEPQPYKFRRKRL